MGMRMLSDAEVNEPFIISQSERREQVFLTISMSERF
jgi:hypothetical protein